MGLYAGLLLSAAVAVAPFQCSRDPDPSKAIEETPAEALYQLATQFKSQGDRKAWRGTLEFLVKRYPSSRFAVTAKADLAEAGAGNDGAK